MKTLNVVSYALGAMALGAAAISAQAADIAAGKALVEKGGCVACHGKDLNAPISPDYPKLAGQHAAYIAKQLADFKTPARNNAVMTAMAKPLSDEDMNNIAAYLAKQQPKPGAAKNKDTIELGKKIYRAGIAEKNVPACAGCHSPDGAGIPAQFARLGGQHQEYTAAQLTAFRSGARKNSPQMLTIAKRLSDDEIQAVADYIAGLK